MVGVPGKFKGCETCRKRRVKCDNTRPYCNKCIDSGRECEGYQRQMVFITATLDDGGRCSSHPPRRMPRLQPGSAGGSSSSSSAASSPLPLMDGEYELNSGVSSIAAVEPFRPAWDDFLVVLNSRSQFTLRNSALCSHISSVNRRGSGDIEFPTSISITIPPYAPADMTRPDGRYGDMTGMLLLSLDQDNAHSGGAKNHCMFLYETQWNEISRIKNFTPHYFTQFPNHHFFARVIRPSFIGQALLSRTPTFLEETEWIVVPFQYHPKAPIDQVFDLIARIPTYLSRLDSLQVMPAAQQRLLQLQELLQHAVITEKHMTDLYNMVIQDHTFWLNDRQVGMFPFTETYNFISGSMAVLYAYHCAGLLLLHGCIVQTSKLLVEPLIDAYPPPYISYPPNMDTTLARYRQGHTLASNICRTFDYALLNVYQPDILLPPLMVAENYFATLQQMGIQNCQNELGWCQMFRSRLQSRGQDISLLVQTRDWIEIGTI